MQLSPRVETWSAGNLSWLGSAHGTDAARTITINVTAAAAKIVNGYIKSGEPLAIVSGLAVPYNSGGSGGTEILAGFLLNDVPVVAGAGNAVGALQDHGRIVLSKLPSAVLATATTTGQFVFV
ncbi:potassium transporter [Nocardia sp. NPDC055049]